MSAVAQKPQAPMTIHYDHDEKTPEGLDFSQYHIQMNDQCRRECQCQEGQTGSSHRACHSSRLRLYLLPALLTLVGLFAFLVLSCVYNVGDLFGTFGTTIANGLARRAAGDSTTSGPLVDRKLYLIIIFVGLLVVVILGVMLSAWCCKSSFQNPLCCPCYLCACCGGLACLECIGCGLCAEGYDAV